MKVCILCFDFKESNIRLQPWRYIYEISAGMKSRAIDVEIITDGFPILPENEKIHGIRIHRLKRFSSYPFTGNSKLIGLIDEISPDVILWSLGPTSFYFSWSLRRITKPVIGLWLGSAYGIREIINLGFGEVLRNFRSIYGHVINSLVPPFMIKRLLLSPHVNKVIVLNENNRERMINLNISPHKISVVRPGITDFDLTPPNGSEVNKLRSSMNVKGNDFVVLYLGSPLSLRGVDTLVQGVSIASMDIPQMRLILLSRKRKDELQREEGYIKELCLDKNIDDRTEVVSAFLSREDVKNYIEISDVVALPFKLVQSDTPISILEVMALGKPLISTRLDGIPELLDGERGIVINPNDATELAQALSTLNSNPQLRIDMGERARLYMSRHPTWEETTQTVVNIIDEVIT